MKRFGKIELVANDITTLKVDVVVNAANRFLRPGGGVDGAIHKAGGRRITEECKTLVEREGPCPTGQVRSTTGGRLRCQYVFHAVGPIWRGGAHQEELQLRKCYANAFDLASRKRLHSIAFPSISTGAYGFPKNKAARVALGEAKRFLSSMTGQSFGNVVFAIVDGVSHSLYEQILESEFVAKPPKPRASRPRP